MTFKFHLSEPDREEQVCFSVKVVSRKFPGNFLKAVWQFHVTFEAVSNITEAVYKTKVLHLSGILKLGNETASNYT